FIRKRKCIIKRCQQPRCISNILKFMEEMMDMPGNTAGGVAMADAIREYDTRNIVAAGKNCRKIAAAIPAGGYGNDVALQSRQFQRAVRFLIAGPQLHATERPHSSSSAIGGFGLGFFELHVPFDAVGAPWGSVP